METATYASIDDRKATLGEVVRFLTCGAAADECVEWPPDVFAVAAALLQRSGAYARVVMSWPPAGTVASSDAACRWIDELRASGKHWRDELNAERPTPAQIVRLWQHVLEAKGTPITSISSDEPLTDALLTLTAISDEACVGLGIPPVRDRTQREAREILLMSQPGGSTLCKQIPRAYLRVLPKLHTPQTGLSLRSLTHNLALCPARDLDARWYMLTGEGKRLLNLLLVPWPKRIRPIQFKPAQPWQGDLPAMPPRYGFFEYNINTEKNVVELLTGLLERVEADVGQVDGVLFPELSLTPSEYESLRGIVLDRRAFLVAGIFQPGTDRALGSNAIALDAPRGGSRVSVVQEKHHRWRLDRNQITQYGLGALDPMMFWWEHIATGNRRLSFFALESWLTMTVLICEDLARQEPVAEVVRAVGPNLVIALLMDGPQLASRWPARYATVLADDPGSSVLTLTSLGMAQLSRAADGSIGSRQVALWKDAQTGKLEVIDCPENADGVLLTIAETRAEEWTADGRSDDQATGYPVFCGRHAVYAAKA